MATPSSSRQSRRRTGSHGRITTACARCQKRKIRCDRVAPVCGSCQRARVDCIEGVTFHDVSRIHVDELESRIKWLESIIRQHLPQIDLNQTDTLDFNQPRRSYHQSSAPSASIEAPVTPTSNAEDAWNPARDITTQLGLVSMNAGGDIRYLGPSSGLFFTRFVLSGLGHRAELARGSAPQAKDDYFVPPGLLDLQPRDLPSELRQAQWLTEAYFQAVHLQFPFLHRPSHLNLLHKAYNSGGDVHVSPTDKFQIFMALAIGSTIRARQTKVLLPVEGYCAAAMAHLDVIFQGSSLRGVQCMLLLQMYTIHNPRSGINLWTLHYNALAHVMELGLHRNVQGSGFTPFDQEMRTRVFWCVYTIDRYLSTLLGRSIGIMDEQCDLRLPRNVNDEDLQPNQPIPTQAQPQTQPAPVTTMSSAIHLFKLARFNAEIKCVLYCVDRSYPPYTQPVVTDAEYWQADMLRRLQEWKTGIPQHGPESASHYLNNLLETKYHELIMLVVRPSPLFNHPSRALTRQCLASALACSALYHELYLAGTLHYTWINVQSLFLCVMTIFYCIWAPGGVREEEKEEDEEDNQRGGGEGADLDTIIHALKTVSDILSATGEYWLEARRSRDVLDCIMRATVRRFARRLDDRGRRLPPVVVASASASRAVRDHGQHQAGQESPHTTASDQMPLPLSLHSTRTIPSSYVDASGMRDAMAQEVGVAFDPYYVPSQQAGATSEHMSFFVGPPFETTMQNFPWDAYGAVDELMHELFPANNV